MVRKPPPGRQMNGDQSTKPDDLESAISATRRRPRFRDIANLAVQNHFHSELKRKLREGVDHDALEKYRMPLDDIHKIKKKKIRTFYESQNDRLNDWLEVDALVMSMADDVLDSMNPVDTDGDGVAEEGGKLMDNKGDIWTLLPEDERERRRQGERRAKWAINVCSALGEKAAFLHLPSFTALALDSSHDCTLPVTLEPIQTDSH